MPHNKEKHPRRRMTAEKPTTTAKPTSAAAAPSSPATQSSTTFAEEPTVPDSWFYGPDEALTNTSHRVVTLPMAIAMRQYRRANFNDVKNGKKELWCTLVIMQTRNCNPWTESLAQCVARFGKANWEKILGEKCIKWPFWMQTLPMLLESLPETEASKDPTYWKKMKRGTIWDSQIWKEGDTTRYIPPSERTYSPFPAPRICSNGKKHYPIAFGIPHSYFVDKVPRTKFFEWMPLMPKQTPARGAYQLTIEDEDIYRELYSQSYGAFTHARAGWDCMRHYDLIAAGVLPFFYGIERCPRNTLGHMPKDLLKKVTRMPGFDHIYKNGQEYTTHNMFGGVNFRKHGTVDFKKLNLTEYYEMADEMLDYGRKYLTTRAVASYLLKVMDLENAKKVLLMSRGPYDYLEITLIHGIQDLGIELVVASQPKDYLYKMRTKDGTATREWRDDFLRPKHGQTYGSAFGFSMRLGNTVSRPFVSTDDQTHVVQPIKNNEFDLVLYAITGNYPRLNEVKNSRAKIAMLQFGDMHGDPSGATRAASEHGTVFIREMNDRGC